ncbi:MAG: hypothetical protein WBG02_03145 [Candidatus Acidiferrum sp.]
MNLANSDFQTAGQSSVAPAQSQTQLQSIDDRAPRIERCEFETLLERAIEILSVRAKSPSSSRA